MNEIQVKQNSPKISPSPVREHLKGRRLSSPQTCTGVNVQSVWWHGASAAQIYCKAPGRNLLFDELVMKQVSKTFTSQQICTFSVSHATQLLRCPKEWLRHTLPTFSSCLRPTFGPDLWQIWSECAQQKESKEIILPKTLWTADKQGSGKETRGKLRRQRWWSNSWIKSRFTFLFFTSFLRLFQSQCCCSWSNDSQNASV